MVHSKVTPWDRRSHQITERKTGKSGLKISKELIFVSYPFIFNWYANKIFLIFIRMYNILRN